MRAYVHTNIANELVPRLTRFTGAGDFEGNLPL